MREERTGTYAHARAIADVPMEGGPPQTALVHLGGVDTAAMVERKQGGHVSGLTGA